MFHKQNKFDQRRVFGLLKASRIRGRKRKKRRLIVVASKVPRDLIEVN